MILGMSTVFIFLTMLVVTMVLNYHFLKFYGKYFPEPVPQVCTSENHSDLNDEIALVIASVKAFKSKG